MAAARASSPRSSSNIPPGPSPGCRGPASWISANPSRPRRVHTGSTFGNSSSTGSIDAAFGGSPTRSGSGFPQPRSPSAVGLARSVTSPSSGRAFFALIFVAVALVMVYMAALPTVNSGGWAADGAARSAVRPGGVDGDALGEMVRREDLEWGAAEGADVGGGVGAGSGGEPAAEGRAGSSSRWGVFSWGGGGKSAGAETGTGTGAEARSAEAEWAAQQAAFKQSAERLAADSAWDGGEWSSSASARGASQFRSAAAAGAALDASLQRPLALTFFSAPKPQPEELTSGSLQQQAVLSWLRLESPTVTVNVVLFGDPSDAVLTSFAAQFPEGRVWVEQVDGNFMGTPMFQSMVARGLVEGPGLGRRFDDGRGAGGRGSGGRAGGGSGAGGGAGDGGVMSVSVLINADIILLKDFPLALRKAAARFPYFLLTAMRWDVSSTPFTFHKPSSSASASSSASFSQTADRAQGEGGEEGAGPAGGEGGGEEEDGGGAGWVPRLTRADGRRVSDAEVVAWAREEGVLHTYGGLDLWAWNNPPLQIGLTTKPIPPFTFGRGRYDNWLLSEAVSSGVRPVIDASDALTSIHVNHSYHHMQRGDQNLLPEKVGNFWSVNKRSSWEVFANIHLSHVHGSWSSQEGMAWHAPWKLMRCDEPASAHLCLLRRVKPGSCRCESSPFVHKTQSEPKLQGRNIVCGVYNTEGKPDLPVMMPLNTAAPVVGLPHLLEQLLPQVADSSGTVTMLAATFDSKEVVADFVCRAARLATRNIVVAALDAAAYRYLFLQGIAVYYQSTNLDGYFLPPEQMDSGKGSGGGGSGGGMWKVLLGRVGAGKGAAVAAGAAGGGAGAAQGERVVEGTRDCFHGSLCFSRFLLAKVTAIASALHLGFNVLWLDTVFAQDQQQQRIGDAGGGAVTMAAIKARIDALRLTSYDPRSRVCARAWTGSFLQAMATGKNLEKKKKAKMRSREGEAGNLFKSSPTQKYAAARSPFRHRHSPRVYALRSAIAASTPSASFSFVSAPALRPRSTLPPLISSALATEACSALPSRTATAGGCSALPLWTATAGVRAMASKAKKKKQPAGGDGGGGNAAAKGGSGGGDAELPGFLRVTASGAVSVAIHAKPGSKQAAVMSLTGDAVGVAIDAPAREGEANAALLEFMADVLGVRKRQVSLQIGSKSRGKVVVVEGVSSQEVLSALQRAVKPSA
ncbi:unnamed protein product [Closterium sp. Yama58-4]|nr:unnamed protein product [Closterium sp. Yama58-4]